MPPSSRGLIGGNRGKTTIIHYVCNMRRIHVVSSLKPSAWPHPVALRSAGINSELADDWRGRWIPSTHIDHYSADQRCTADWASYDAPTTCANVGTGRGVVSAHAAAILGHHTLPGCSNMWRTVGPEPECTARYAADLQEEFPDKEFRSLALAGDS